MGCWKLQKNIVLQVVNPGEMIGDLDEKAAKELGLQQWNKTKGTVYRLDSKTLLIFSFDRCDNTGGPRIL